MQQTEKYGLNLMEKTDTFSPDTLNENTKKIEELVAVREIRYGSYVGNGQEDREIDLGFAPKLLILMGKFGSYDVISVVGRERGVLVLPGGVTDPRIMLTNAGFHLYYSYAHNVRENTEHYIALG